MYEEPTQVRIGPILSFQSCYYKAPLTYPDTVYVGARITSIEGSKILIEHSLVSEKLNRKVAEGEAHIIWYDYEQKKKSPHFREFEKKIIKII